ncbi:MAG: 30S ribosomal protein S19e [Thaumarchaeota archaeon]|jgi:small subunit ribosomal protein S19e|nr:30S ribosomal protein S19e [Nitrososphaerota archaeon]
MAKVHDVPADVLLRKLTDILKNEDIPAPSWASFVKTGSHADRPPHEKDWWHIRCASILRKIYLHGPIGINDLRKEFGGGKPVGYGAAHHRDAGGAIIRNAIHGLEKLGYVEKVEKKGRVVTKQGMQKLDRLATEILKELATENQHLKVYS